MLEAMFGAMAISNLRSFVVLYAFFATAVALQVTPGSPCSKLCTDSSELDINDPKSSNTRDADIECDDKDFENGISQFQKCTECLQTSSFGTATENDQTWFIHNLRYAADWCLFNDKNPNGIAGPCMDEATCGVLSPSFNVTDGEPKPGSTFDYCLANGGGFGAGVDTCNDCVQHMDHNKYVSNWLLALKAGCDQRPSNAALIGLGGSVFSTEPVQILSTIITPAEAASRTKKDPDGLGIGAIVGIAVGGVIVTIIIAVIAFLRCRKKRRNSKKIFGGPTPKSEYGFGFKPKPKGRATYEAPTGLKPYNGQNNVPDIPVAAPKKDIPWGPDDVQSPVEPTKTADEMFAEANANARAEAEAHTEATAHAKAISRSTTPDGDTTPGDVSATSPKSTFDAHAAPLNFSKPTLARSDTVDTMKTQSTHFEEEPMSAVTLNGSSLARGRHPLSMHTINIGFNFDPNSPIQQTPIQQRASSMGIPDSQFTTPAVPAMPTFKPQTFPPPQKPFAAPQRQNSATPPPLQPPQISTPPRHTSSPRPQAVKPQYPSTPHTLTPVPAPLPTYNPANYAPPNPPTYFDSQTKVRAEGHFAYMPPQTAASNTFSGYGTPITAQYGTPITAIRSNFGQDSSAPVQQFAPFPAQVSQYQPHVPTPQYIPAGQPTYQSGPSSRGGPPVASSSRPNPSRDRSVDIYEKHTLTKPRVDEPNNNFRTEATTRLTKPAIPPPPCPIIKLPQPKKRGKSALLTPEDVARANRKANEMIGQESEDSTRGREAGEVARILMGNVPSSSRPNTVTLDGIGGIQGQRARTRSGSRNRWELKDREMPRRSARG